MAIGKKIVLALCLCVAILGLALRFADLGEKTFCVGETTTMVYATGHVRSEAQSLFNDGRDHYASEFQSIQSLDDAKPAVRGLKGLMREDAQHSPLYFVIASAWVRFFGESVSILRALSALLGGLAVLASFFLGKELFESEMAGWLALAVTALAPIQVLFSQDASESVLLILFSELILITYLRKSWFWFILLGVVGLYSSLFVEYVFASLLVYTYFSKDDWVKSSVRTLKASIVLVNILFSPWLIQMAWNHQTIAENMKWVGESPSVLGYLRSIFVNISRSVVDFNLRSDLHGDGLPLVAVVGGFVAIVAVLALIIAYRGLWRTRRDSFYLLLSLFAVPLVFNIAQDLIWGGQRGTDPHFQLISTLALEFAVVGYLAERLLSTDLRRRERAIVYAGFVFSCALVSLSFYVNSPTWWNKNANEDDQAVARVISHNPGSMVIGDDVGQMMSLSRYLANSTIVRIAPPFVNSHALQTAPMIFIQSEHPAELRAKGPFSSFLVRSGGRQYLQLTRQ